MGRKSKYFLPNDKGLKAGLIVTNHRCWKLLKAHI